MHHKIIKYFNFVDSIELTHIFVLTANAKSGQVQKHASFHVSFVYVCGNNNVTFYLSIMARDLNFGTQDISHVNLLIRYMNYRKHIKIYINAEAKIQKEKGKK